LVKFYVNNIESQKSFDRLIKYQGRYLQIYNYPKQHDSMSALHAKVISIDQQETLITSANLSYHGQEGNIEMGTHIISNEIAAHVEQLFTQLTFSRVFEKFSP
jgi:phosphatidylserine/phosphatidylglycerophosphate/cardiolipin synthase-like enzyme